MTPRRRRATTVAGVLVALVLAPGCGKRGDPLAPLPRTPQPVTELKLSQRGGSLLVSFVTPRVTTGGLRLPVMDVELQRADGPGDFAKLSKRDRSKAAPGETVVSQGPLPAPGTQVRVAVRALSGGQPSSLTPVVTLTAQAPPPPPTGLTGRLVPAGVELAWRAPVMPAPAATPSPSVPVSPSPSPAASPPRSATPAPSPSPASPSPAEATPRFWIYRREKSGTYARPLEEGLQAAARFADGTAQPGQSVCYVVRTVLSDDPVIESEDSNEVCLDVRDVKPPATPAGLTALAREGAVELSWSPGTDPDIARYRLYRVGPDGKSERVAEVPAGETTFRDPAGAPGTAYTITAVDAAGNESPPSRAAAVTEP